MPHTGLDIGWLDEKKGNTLDDLRHRASELFRASQTLDRCDHGEAHCRSIENALHVLIPKQADFDKLTLDERYYLLASPWLLNLGWNEVSNPGERTLHKLSSDKLNERKLYFDLDQDDLKVFSAMIEFHEFSRDLNECPARLQVGPGFVRVRLLAAYLRLADVVHQDDCRGPETLFYFLKRHDSPELFHWLKSRLDIDIVPDADREVIEININQNMHPTGVLVSDLTTNATIFLDSVKDVLVKGGITRYLSVDVRKQIIRDIPPDRKKSIAKMMAEYELSFPPNAGTLQDLYLLSLQSKVRSSLERTIGFNVGFEAIRELQGVAEEAKRFRPCHVGLDVLIHKANELLAEPGADEDRMKELDTFVSSCIRDRSERRARLLHHAARQMAQYDAFVLFGFSTSIIDSFAEMARHWRQASPPSVVVCEAHNKSQYNLADKLVYVDGVAYARKLLEAFPSAVVEVIPDANIANVFLEKRAARWVVLFGANGIGPDGSMGHSAGHLTTAIVAKHYGLPVWVVSDSSKIGSLKPHPRREREDQWLKGMSSMMGPARQHIQFSNIRESITPRELINGIVTEDGVFGSDAFAARYGPN
jgi:translation initiation factor 2B subunit (eIF-2B alpha/beta/delta family)